ncbi:transglutaminase-like domain-containing protein [Demequina lutea]|uniref:Transglutaminase-like putative cysteine protease n=1 Tax=Demequina lutea TaxID=431489 RepID=A0A7Y9ZCI0_9MICO|nr:transglutaminase family protein [Demequina lutea]NYI41470.1 transglutaminase-like putative cysteine protease [Demequina lutea]
MRRNVTAHLTIDVTSPSELAMSIGAASRSGDIDERLDVRLDGAPLHARVIGDAHGTRLHAIGADVGLLTIDYAATIEGREPPAPSVPRDLIRYLRPSRYCESDELAATANAEFGGLTGHSLLSGVSSWVGTRLEYVSGSSLPTDGAVRTLLARRGVCRDYAHLCVALLRASGVPARLVSVYAPGLSPMDFHAVCEAHVEGEWCVVDATALAPRTSLVRIATGRDAADTAFMTVVSGHAELIELAVSAVVDALPHDDLMDAIHLG